MIIPVRHLVGDSSNGLTQSCLICGKIICDYRNAYSIGEWKPAFWEAGYIYQAGKNPQTTFTTLNEGEEFVKCSDL